MPLSIRLTDSTLEFSDDNTRWLPLRPGFEAQTLRAILHERNQGQTKFGTLGSPSRDLAHHFQHHDCAPSKGCAHCQTRTSTLRENLKLEATESSIEDLLV